MFITVAFAAWMFGLPLRRAAPRRFPVYGWWALATLAALEVLLALRTPGVTTFFTALIWSAYIPMVDAAVFRLRGDSMLHHPGRFTAMALLSIPGWLLFEAYNLRLRNWAYVGMPRHFWVFTIGAAWAFATIFPGILETAELFFYALTSEWHWKPWRHPNRFGLISLGAALVLIPLLAPRETAAYLFALVWAGFILLLDPLHRGWGWPSLLEDLEAGRPGVFTALLLSGAACGFFWEFWNFWAGSRWEYVFPIFHRFRIFAMPVPGFLGFPPFAIECFILYSLMSQLLLPERLRCSLFGNRYARLKPRGTQEDICPHAPI